MTALFSLAAVLAAGAGFLYFMGQVFKAADENLADVGGDDWDRHVAEALAVGNDDARWLLAHGIKPS